MYIKRKTESMKKKTYVSPSMSVMTVELEHGFMASSIVNDSKEGVHIKSEGQSFEEIDFSSDSFRDNVKWE